MNRRFLLRALFFGCLLGCVWPLTACSFITNFVIVNASNQPLEVRYKLKPPADPRAPAGEPVVPPATKPVSQLQQEVSWNQLSASQYKLDREKREVAVLLPPGYALLVEQRNLVDGPTDDAHQAANFSIEEINLSGAGKQVHLQGDEVRKGFVPESKKLYTITYR